MTKNIIISLHGDINDPNNLLLQLPTRTMFVSSSFRNQTSIPDKEAVKTVKKFDVFRNVRLWLKHSCIVFDMILYLRDAMGVPYMKRLPSFFGIR